MPDFSHEERFCGPVIGIDEAGRGPWAGPVTVAAVWLGGVDVASLPAGIDDSKKLKAPVRSGLAARLAAAPYVHHTVSVDVAAIDRIGILQATFRGMVLAAEGVAKKLQTTGLPMPVHALVDGNLLPPNMPLAATALVKGDSRSLSIAAASIIAKASRDDIMAALHKDHPHYGWDRNMGYGTNAHVAGLDHYGISPHHRRSFKPVRRYLDLAGD